MTFFGTNGTRLPTRVLVTVVRGVCGELVSFRSMVQPYRLCWASRPDADFSIRRCLSRGKFGLSTDGQRPKHQIHVYCLSPPCPVTDS